MIRTGFVQESIGQLSRTGQRTRSERDVQRHGTSESGRRLRAADVQDREEDGLCYPRVPSLLGRLVAWKRKETTPSASRRSTWGQLLRMCLLFNVRVQSRCTSLAT